MTEALAVEDLVAGYGATVVLDGLSFDLPRAARWRCWGATASARPRCSRR